MSLASSIGAGSERCFLEAVALLQGGHLQLVNGLDHLVELALQLLVVADIEVAGEQGVEGLVEVRLGGFQMAGLVVGLPGGVLLFGLGDQGVDRRWTDGLRLLRFLDLGLLRAVGLLCGRRSDFRSVGLRRQRSGLSWLRRSRIL